MTTTATKEADRLAIIDAKQEEILNKLASLHELCLQVLEACESLAPIGEIFTSFNPAALPAPIKALMGIG